jgi:hypothetical protein
VVNRPRHTSVSTLDAAVLTAVRVCLARHRTTSEDSTPVNPSVNKRQKEAARQDRAREKADKRKQRRDEKSQRAPGADGVDPDIAGIVPGPQPPIEDA